jgi:hypothetical protein
VPAQPDSAVLAALEYALSMSQDVIAVHVNSGQQQRDAVLARWKKCLGDVPLIVLDSPSRSVLRPLLHFIFEVRDLRGDGKVTVVLTQVLPRPWWFRLLGRSLYSILQDELQRSPGVVVTTVQHRLHVDQGGQKRTGP